MQDNLNHIEARLHYQLIWVPSNGYFVKFSVFGALRQNNKERWIDFTARTRFYFTNYRMAFVLDYSINFTETVSEVSPLNAIPKTLQVFRRQILSVNPQIFSGRHLSPAKCFSMNWGWTILLQQFLMSFRRIAFML